jgi:hypothetical protein
MAFSYFNFRSCIPKMNRTKMALAVGILMVLAGAMRAQNLTNSGPSAVMQDNPVGYWRLNETGSTAGGSLMAVDMTGNHNGVYGPAARDGIPGPESASGFWGFEPSNTAAQFTYGVANSFVTIPQLNLNTNTVTITTWIYPIGTTGPYCGLAYWRSGGDASGLDFSTSGQLGYTWNQNAPNTWGWNSGLVPPLNQWSFVALVISPASAIIYLCNANGVQSSTNAIAHTAETFNAAMLIGSDPQDGGGGRTFNGIMDEVAVFNSSLNQNQVLNLYFNGVAGALQATPPTASPSTNLFLGDSVVLSELALGVFPFQYQWETNGVFLPGATNKSLVLTNLTLAASGNYRVIVSNSFGVATSAPVILSVTFDTTPPTVLRVLNIGSTNVEVDYSKLLEAASATNVANYVLTNGIPVSSASLSANNTTVILTTAPLVYGSNYTLVINSVRDQAVPPNTIATNTRVSFTASAYTPQDIGNPSILSSATVVSNGLTVTAAGSDIGGSADQFNFEYQSCTGDFDVSVRVAGLTPSDVWAKVGLMARETLAAGGRFTASIATPAMNGCFFEWRDPAGSASSSSGNFPANYPNTWLRLKRAGNTFTGFAGYDCQTWAQLGSVSISMSNQVYLGFAVSSHNTNQPTTAQFLNYQTTPTNAVVGTVVNPHEPLGPSSRKTGIVFSEIMWKPAPRTDGNNVEFIEIYNSNPWFHDLSGYQIVCADMNYTFPANTIMPGGAFFVIASSPQGIQNVYGLTTNIFGPYTGSLKKSETLQLIDEQGAVLLTVPYSNIYPWPVAAEGTGHSIVLANPSYGEGDPRAWDISDAVGGSPGQMDAFHPSPLRCVVINEFLAHTDPPDYDYIELYNHSTNAVDLSGCILTDDPATNKFVIPSGTIIPARGFVFYSETNMNFALNAAGESIYFKNPGQTRILDAVQFLAQQNGVATGRWPDGANDFYRLSAKTPGSGNAPILTSDVVINELMYDPISGNDDDQYIELYNKGTNTINLAGWQFTSGVTFTFPSITIASNGYLVVARNLTNLFAKYPNLNSANTVGNYSGKLSHNGEYLALTMPAEHKTTDNNGNPVTNIINIAVNDLTYGTGGRWGEWSSGGGSSLELIDPKSNNRLAANWADSDETQKSAWTNIEYTGVLDNGANYDSSIDYAQIGLLDVGECLVDNIEVDYNGTNYVSNGAFESGTNGWSFQGCLTRSSLENTGYVSSHSLHIRCSDRIWTGVNSCQVALNANSLASGQTATLRFKARWLHGWPEPLLRLNGNWLEATGAMPIPTNLGTPGQPNSRYVTNAGPAIYSVTHTPTLPAASQPAVVTVRVHDPNGVQNLTLYYRLDPATSYTAVTMKDDGTGGDAIAGDGVFSATIPGQVANQIAAFYISARDSNSVATRFPALRPPDNEPVRECVVMFGDGNPGGSFGVYHLWLTQTNVTRWANLSDLSNEMNDGTFVNGPRVIYDAQGRFAGSPYHQNFDTPNGSYCHYKWVFPDDDQFLGTTDFNKIHQPGNGAGDDGSLQREQTAYTFMRSLGVPWLYRRYVAVYVNGSRRGTLMEDTQVPGGDMVKEYFPNDTDGYLYKMQPWFEFAPFPTGSTIAFNENEWVTLNNYTTTGEAKKAARYRYNFEIRRTADSANNFAAPYSLVNAANSYGTPNYVANMENLADMENWMRVFAANHAAANRDSFGAITEQNLYGYIGTLGTKYSLLMFDFNICLDHGSWGPGQDLFLVDGDDPYVADIYSNPTFLRMYWRALQELVNGPLTLANTAPLCNAKYSAFTANGLSVEDPNASMLPWIAWAGTSIASQLAAVNAASFMVTGVTTNNNVAHVTGTAPVNVDTVWINGVAYPLIWTTLTNWTITLPLANGTNQLSVVGVDINGQPITGDSNSVSVVCNGTNSSPDGQVVINEIMYAPAVNNAQFVELYNNSTNATFDLSGWQLQGLSYTFPNGSLLGPTNYLILAVNGAAFAEAYGATNPVFDTFSGALSPNGKTLTLNNASNVPVAKVKYENQLPWPTNANGTGASLQLIDPHQDNWRVGNWTAASTNTTVTPQWTYVTATGTTSSSLFYIYLLSAGDVYVDDIKLVAGSVPGVGANVLSDGDFESGFPGPWTVSTNLTNSVLSTTIKHSGNASLHLISTSAATSQGTTIWQIISPALTTNATYTLSFWYLQSTNGGPLIVRLSGSGPVADVNPAPPMNNAIAFATPGTLNSVATVQTPFPSLWLNELQADNLNGITNRAGQHTGWLELYNPGTNVISLNGLYLANNYTNLLQWAFPTNAVINAGQFLVIFADGLTSLSTTNELHANFILPGGTGSLALTRLATNGRQQVLDFVDYQDINPNDSYGSFPDGQSFNRQEFFQATPGAPNNGTATPPPSFIDYAMPGSVYTQNFDSLPDPGASSVNTANPATINGVTYSLANPYDFAFPVVASGSTGGLGISALAGWYGSDVLLSRFGATDGDQTTGGQLSFGLTNSSNRALGLLATSTTGGTAFGVRFINGTAITLTRMNLQFTGEVWRQSDKSKTLQFYYFIDPTGTNSFPTNTTALISALNVNFPTVSADSGGVAVDGTSPLNQTNRSVLNQAITNWPPGAALWLVWQMTDNTGKAQGLGIDNLSFSASIPLPVPVDIQISATNLLLNWSGVAGQTYQLEYKNNLTDPAWTPLGGPVTGTGGTLTLTNDFGASPQRFFHLRLVN